MKRFYFYLCSFIVFSILLFSGCELINPGEPTPAYIHIDKFTLVANPAGFTSTGTEGSLSTKITDAWVYLDEQLVGCFQLPVTFPVLAEGTHTIKLRAGIKVNGIAATRAPYPFYESYSQTIDFQPGIKTTLTPTIQYASSTTFAWLENFEGASNSTVGSHGTDTLLLNTGSIVPANVFEGGSSGAAYLDANRIFFECISPSYPLPKSGAAVFLELNYKSNTAVTFGLYAYTGASFNQVTAINLHASENWNKAYIYLSPIISQNVNADHFNVFMGMVNNTNADSMAFLVDNLKLVY
jgi:hypothetical protein